MVVQATAKKVGITTGILSAWQEGYELTTPDHIIYFWGSFDHHAVNITDEVKWTLFVCTVWPQWLSFHATGFNGFRRRHHIDEVPKAFAFEVTQ